MIPNLSRPLSVITAEPPAERLFDVYIQTTEGEIKRISMPEDRRDFLYWILDPEAGHPADMFDQHVRHVINETPCNYAEAASLALKGIEDDTSYYLSWSDAQRDKKYWIAMKNRAGADQMLKCNAWREAHDEWRHLLPPAFD